MNIYQKLIEVRKSVKFLKKETKGFNYLYVSSSQAICSVREKMDEMGLLLECKVIKTAFHPNTLLGGKEHLTEITMLFTWVNAEKPEEKIRCRWYGQGVDNQEKGVGKAYTYAEKYFILKFFNIPTDKDDPDNAQPEKKKEVQKKTTKPVSLDLVSDKQIKLIKFLTQQLGENTSVWVGKFENMTKEKASATIAKLQDRKLKKEKAKVPEPAVVEDEFDGEITEEDMFGKEPIETEPPPF